MRSVDSGLCEAWRVLPLYMGMPSSSPTERFTACPEPTLRNAGGGMKRHVGESWCYSHGVVVTLASREK
jgi:hypothetical protein